MHAMALSVVLFVVSDALVKVAGADLPAAQTVGLSSLFATLWLGLAAVLIRARVEVSRPVVLRGLVGCVGLYAYLVSLFHLPLSVAISVKMVGPLLLSAFASVWLGERGHWRAVIVGFLGAVLATSPDRAHVSLWLGLALLATVANAVRDAMTRLLPSAASSLWVALVGSALAAVVGLAWSAVDGWQPVTPPAAAILLGGALLLAAAYHLLVKAMRGPDIAAAGWLRYTALFWAAGIGYAFWGEVPTVLGLLGMGMIVASGLWLLRGDSHVNHHVPRVDR